MYGSRMALWAAVALIAYTLVNTSLIRYQRFTTRIARAVSDELGGDNGRRQVAALQRFMTPFLLASISWVCYVVLAMSFVFAYRASGWPGAILVAGWGYIGVAFLSMAWPLPPIELCVQLASSEVKRGSKLPKLTPEEREMVRGLILKHLEAASRVEASPPSRL